MLQVCETADPNGELTNGHSRFVAATGLLTWIRRARAARLLRNSRIPALRWRDTVAQLPLAQQLLPAERHRLRELASEFLRIKAISGAAGLLVTDEMRSLIAAQACLLILALDMSYFDGWYEVIVYPDSFIVQHDEVDADGVVHGSRRVLGGESWSAGPVILSWADAYPPRTAANVVLHEFAHKLDMLNGAANGMPPLHRDMQQATWTRVFQHAYDNLAQQRAQHHHSCIDSYALENPAEFFAVCSETFFMDPHCLQQAYPALYAQLRQFYRQDPLQRQTPHPSPV